MRIAATSILNINVSAAGIETFVGGSLSWRRQLELEQKAIKLNEVTTLVDFLYSEEALKVTYYLMIFAGGYWSA